jgi:hypothetical protein
LKQDQKNGKIDLDFAGFPYLEFLFYRAVCSADKRRHGGLHNMKKCVRFVTAWLLTIVMVAVTVFQWGGLAAGAGGTVQAADLIDLSDEDTNNVKINLTNSTGNFRYTGSPIEPEISVTVNGQTISPNCYTVEYKDNVELRKGTESAEIWIYGIESRGYTGSQYAYFHIIEGNISKADVAFKGDAYYNSTGSILYVPYVKPGVMNPLIDKVSYGGKKLTENKDYTLTKGNALKGVGGSGNLVITGKSGSNWSSASSYSKKIPWQVVKADIASENITMEYTNCTYDGTAKAPKITIEDSRFRTYYPTATVDGTLEEGTDYTVTYGDAAHDNIQPGTVKVVITGKGNYSGSVEKEFTISDAGKNQDISQADIKVSDATYTGAAVTPDVKVVYAGTTLKKDKDYTVQYRNNINVGTMTATAVISGMGDYTGSVEKNFTINKKDLSDPTIKVTASDVTYAYGSNVSSPVITVTDTASGKELTGGTYGTDYTISYPTRPTEVGDNYSFTITAKAASNYTGTATGTYRVLPLDVSQSAQVTLAQTEYEYNGEAFKPAVTAVVVNGITLETRKDYAVDYKDNIDAGDKAKVIVTFKGNYTGSVTSYFTITSPLPNVKDASLTIADQTYTGKQITPDVSTITIAGQTFTKGKDYTVTYGENKNVGYGQITLTGNKQTCAGTRLIEFKINAANINRVCTVKGLVSGQKFAYTGSAIIPKISVIYGNITLVENEDYTIQYSSSNPVKAGSYVVVITGKGNYTDHIDLLYMITSVSIDSATVKYAEYDNIYNGSAKKPKVTSIVTEDGTTITDLNAFDVTYTNNVDAGTATITVKPKSTNSNYTGTASTTFTIKKATLSNDTCTISTVSNQTFTENEIKPEPTLTIAGRTLVKGTDYTADYTDNINVGTATIRFTGTGNYTGNAVKTFNIVSKSIAGAKVTVPSQTYTGSALAPSADQVTVVLDGKTLDSKYYTVKYTNNTKAGTATATVTGKNGYSDLASGDFTIEKATIDSCTAEYSGKMMWNNGQAISPEITLKLGNYTLVKGTDYTVTYNNNQNETTKAEINVTGTGNFTGTKTYYFEITRNRTDINDSSIKVNASDLEYDGGKEVTPVITVTQNGKLLAEGESYDVTVTNKTNGYEVGSVITVKLTGKDAFAGTREATFKITAVDLTGAAVELENETFEYTGDVVVPVVKMITTKSGKKITDLSELKVQPSYNTNAGTATVTITGKTNNYTGSTTKTFEIQKKSIAAADIICEVKDATYKESQIQPKTSDEIKVTRNGKKLSLWTDYKIVSYGENINAGKDAGSIVIEGVNNYTGQKTVYFTINPQSIAGATVNVNRSYTYNGKAWEPQASDLTVSVNGRQLGSGDYTITGYDKNTDAGTATVTVAGVDNYTGTMTGNFTIAAKNLQDSSIDVRCASKVSYEDGKACTPTVRIKDGDKDLTENVDYTVTYENNTAVTTEYSKAKAIAKGMGNYTGQVTKEFEISKDIINITGATVTVNKTFVYNGNAQTPEKTDITVKLADGTVLDNTSYTIVAVKDNVGAGTATITVEGCGDYSGTASGTYMISPKNITECQVHYSSSVDYTSAECKPGVTVMDGEAVELTKDKDYTVSYSNNTNPGTATITIKGQGNYTGTYTGSFTIVKNNDPTPEKINLSSAVITVADQTYTGQALIPSITVVLNGAVLPASAYTVAYVNNVNVGTATVTVTGQGNYVGSASATFTIKAAAKPVAPTVTKPGKVKGISVKSVKTTSATLKWKKVSGASGYMIYRKNSSTGKSKLVKTVSSKTVSYKATKLKSATKYTYTIYAYKLSGKTKIKGSGTAYTFVTKPGAVKKTKAVSKKSKTCVVSWKKTKGADGYEVYMATSKKGKYKKIGQTKKVTLTKKKLKKGKTCYFKVRAYKTYKGKKTYGAYTKVIKAKIK